MRSGFLASPGGALKPRQRGDSAQEVLPPAAAAAAAAARPPPTPEAAAAGLAQCLELLKGPSDERRFVGLLLVTKLLPAGDEPAVRAVHAAVGPTFLARLLLPLRLSSAPPADAEAASKQAATCALGLAVLAGFARLPDLAAAPDVLDKLPLLLGVVRAGGVGALLAARRAGAGAGAASEPAMDADADAATVQDALECAVAVARCGSQGAAVAAESDAVGAAVAALAAAPPTAPEQLSLALQLLAAVLADEQRRAELLQGDQATVLQHLLPALARVFALPAQQLGANIAGKQQEQRQQSEDVHLRLLAIQLESLHVLLLLLPLPHGSVLPEQRGRGGAPAWPAQLRQGLSLLLRGRISAVQRHSALQLAAAIADLAGPGWLLGREAGASSGSSSGSGSGSGGARSVPPGGSAEAFFQLLVEVTKVETSVLLHDALAPDVPVPLAAAAAPAAGEWHAPAPRRGAPGSDTGSECGDGNDAAGAELAADLAGSDGAAAADVEPLMKILASEEDRRQLEEQLGAQHREAAAQQGQQPQRGEHVRRVDGVPLPTDQRWEGPTEASGERAGRVLPSCFALLEACVEALAVDTQSAEAMEIDSGAAAPALSPGVAQRALFSLQEAAEVVLQFVEQTAGEEEEEEEEGSSGGTVGSLVRHALLVAALRVVARFCAEVPEAFGGRLRPLLPHLLPLRLSFGAAGGMGDVGADGEALLEPAEGTTFLLPLLLQVTARLDAGSATAAAQHERQLWLDALAEPEAAAQVADYARTCGAACVPTVTTAAGDAADDALFYACELLLNVFAGAGEGGGAAAAASEAAQRQRRRRRQLLRTGAAAPLLRALLQLPRMRPLVLPPDCSTGDVLASTRLLTTVAAVCGVVAAAAAEELAAGALWLELSAQQQQQQLASEGRPEARRPEGHRLRRSSLRSARARDAPAEPEAPPLPFLGPLSGRLMEELCSELLVGIHVLAQLLASGPLRDGELAAAQRALARDAELAAELARQLNVAAAAAATLLQHYAPFEALCQDAAWLAAPAGGSGGGGRDQAAPPGLQRFAQALAGVLHA